MFGQNRLNRQQKEELKSFKAVTGAGDKTAIEVLKSENWNLQRAIDNYYSSMSPPNNRNVSRLDKRSIEKIFKNYKDVNESVISVDGVSRMCEDLKVDPADVSLLVFSWHLGAENMGEFKQDEFINGLMKLGCDSIEKLQRRLPELKAELENEETFKKVYEYAFLFSRERGVKFVAKSMAIGLWQLLFQGYHSWPLLNEWCQYLESKEIIAIQKDTWDQLLDFTKTIKTDFSNFDLNGAWPYLIDEFVEDVCQKRGQKLSSNSI